MTIVAISATFAATIGGYLLIASRERVAGTVLLLLSVLPLCWVMTTTKTGFVWLAALSLAGIVAVAAKGLSERT